MSLNPGWLSADPDEQGSGSFSRGRTLKGSEASRPVFELPLAPGLADGRGSQVRGGCQHQRVIDGLIARPVTLALLAHAALRQAVPGEKQRWGNLVTVKRTKIPEGDRGSDAPTGGKMGAG